MKIIIWYNRHVEEAQKLIEQFNGSTPFSLIQSRFFKANRKFGSKDRRRIKDLCYGYFRLGHLFTIDFQQKIQLWTFLQNHEDELIMNHVASNLGFQKIKDTYQERLESIFKKLGGDVSNLFSSIENVSKNLDNEALALAMLRKPKVWLRANKEKAKKVKEIFDKNEIGYSLIEPNTFGLIKEININQVQGLKSMVEVQDYSSQKTVLSLEKEISGTVWDCCCGAGGKSLAILDSNPSISLYASDNRNSILQNFRLRMRKNNHQVSNTVLDLSKQIRNISFKNEVVEQAYFNTILADVPCTGSGVWSRNPDQMAAFNPIDVKSFIALQRQIIKNAIPFLQEGGRLIYITCSVFEKENELQVEYFSKEYLMNIESQDYHKGYLMASDTMYYAVLKKNRS